MSSLQLPVPQPPICVDLDGTLIKTNTLHEAALAAFRNAPWILPLFPYWLLRGQAYLWQRLVERISLDPSLLPYRKEVLDYLEAEKGRGRELMLISGSHQLLVEGVARHLGIFDRSMGSTEKVHLVAKEKLAAIATSYGALQFDYVGDSSKDMAIWEQSRKAVIVSADQRLIDRLKAMRSNAEVIRPSASSKLKPLIKALRPHQWTKNLLIFVPLLLGHKISQLPLIMAALKGFVAFSLCGSSVYVINDLTDLEADRAHPRKRLRPFAAGSLSALAGVVMSFALMIAAFAMGAAVSPEFLSVLASYFALTLLYSFWLKEKLLVDVFLLASLYTIRVWAGGAATGIQISHWALAFFMCLSLSLALSKRYSELLRNPKREGEQNLKRRGYRAPDMQLLMSLGASSALLSALVVALYISSPDVVRYYSRPHYLWLVCPALAYWSSRLWIIASRGALDEDPVLFAIKDKVSYALGLVIALTVLLAI